MTKNTASGATSNLFLRTICGKLKEFKNIENKRLPRRADPASYSACSFKDDNLRQKQESSLQQIKSKG
jgi:hypothetical protein